MSKETKVAVTPVVPPVYTDAQQINILKLQRKILSLKNALGEIAQQHANVLKQHEQTMVELDTAVKEVVDAANFDMEGYAFNLETLMIEPKKK